MKTILGLILLLALVCIFHLKVLVPFGIFTSQDFERGDLSHYNYPGKYILSESFVHRTLPLWTDKIYTGFPVYSEGQNGTLYLPNIILFSLLPTPIAFTLSFVVTFTLSAWGMYLYCRYHKISYPGSLLAAIAFAFSMYFVGHVIHLNFITVASLIPFVFLLGEKFFDQPNRLHFGLFVLVLSQQLFAGYFQLVFYTLLGLSLLILYKLIRNPDKWRHSLGLCVAVGAALGLCAVQLWPTLEFFGTSIRQAKMPYEFITLFPYTLKDLLLFVRPYIFGDPSLSTFHFTLKERIFWENSAYIGILPLILAIISLKGIKRKSLTLFYIFLLVFTIIIALGYPKILFAFPGFSIFRVPQKILILTVFSIAFLAAQGFDLIRDWFKAVTDNQFLEYALLGFVLTFCFLDVYSVGSAYNGGLPYQKWLSPPKTAQYLQKNLGNYRIYAVGWQSNWDRIDTTKSHGWRSETAETLLETFGNINPDVNVIYDIPSADGYTGSVTRGIDEYRTIISEGIKESNNAVSINARSLNLLSMLAVKYIVSAKPISSNLLKEVFTSTEPLTQTTFRIYENPQAVSRIRPIGQLETIGKPGDLKKTVSSWDPTTAYLQSSGPYPAFDSSAQIKLKPSDTPQTVSFSVDSSKNTFVVVADTYYPGWQAYVGGKDTKIYPVNLTSRGIFVPSGHSEVVMKYEPESLTKGAMVSVISFILLMGFVWYKPKFLFS